MNNQQILSAYIPLVSFLGIVCGCNYEIVLHDASNAAQSIVAIANGHISGRKVGGSMTDLALKLIREELYKTQDYVVNKGTTKDNKVVISSTLFIKDKNQKLIGMLCVNNNVSEMVSFNEYLVKILSSYSIMGQSESREERKPSENIDISVDELIKNAIDNIFSNIEVPAERLSQAEKGQIVQNLNEQGIFLLKGAVAEVASRLKSSEPTIYRYLNKK